MSEKNRDMNAQQMCNELRQQCHKAFTVQFGGVIALHPNEAAAPIYIDGRARKVTVVDKIGDGAPDCVWRGEAEMLLRVLDGDRALESAYIAGRLVIEGDMSIMTRLELAAQ